MITQQEFEIRLKDNKWFDKPEDLIEYRLPVCQYYLTNLSKVSLTINGHTINSRLITIEYRDQDFTLVNEAFLSIRKQFGYE